MLIEIQSEHLWTTVPLTLLPNKTNTNVKEARPQKLQTFAIKKGEERLNIILYILKPFS